MLHIYRQITSLRRVHPVVIAQKRENAQSFPFADLVVVTKSRAHFLRRLWYRQLRDAPWHISAAETARLLRALQSTNAKLLHVYFGHIAVHLLPLLRSWKRPAVVSFHGADVGVDLRKPAYRQATQEMLRTVRRVLVRSESLRDALLQLGAGEEKVVIQRTGIPLHDFAFRERDVPRDGEWRLLQASRLIAKKGLKTTLRAFAEFRATFPRAGLVIAGEGPMEAALGELARELHIDVRFTGFIGQSELRQLFYSSHMFLHPSETGPDGNQEGVPNSLLEAMATGLPVFATRHGGIPEAVENGVSGVLVAERDATAFAQALVEAAQDPARLAAMGRAAHESVSMHFDQREQTRRLEEIYLREIAAS